MDIPYTLTSDIPYTLTSDIPYTLPRHTLHTLYLKVKWTYPELLLIKKIRDRFLIEHLNKKYIELLPKTKKEAQIRLDWASSFTFCIT